MLFDLADQTLCEGVQLEDDAFIGKRPTASPKSLLLYSWFAMFDSVYHL